MAAIFRVSVMPPACDGSGWMMSTWPASRIGLKSHREQSRSPRAIGALVSGAISASA